MKGFVEMSWSFDCSKHGLVVIKKLAPYVAVRGNLAEAARKHGIDLALLTKLAKGETKLTPHYIYKLIRRGLFSVKDFVSEEEINSMEKDEQSFWLKMRLEQNTDLSYFFNQAMLQGKEQELLEAVKKVVMS